jgi:RimJ/RimL family protein N-acetyltransferase
VSGDANLKVGQPVDDRAAERPGPVTLAGRFGRLARLDAARHCAGLWDALRGHDAIWTYLPDGPFSGEDDFARWLAGCEQHPDRYFYSLFDQSGRAAGVLSLMEIRPAMRVIEVGYIVYSPALQRTALATEIQYLLARHVFETLRYRRYEWKCNALNAASRRAALRFGFIYEGIFRQHMIVKGHNRDTAWFSMLDSEWPARKANFERWLAPDNFTADSRQKTSLSAMNAAGVSQ